KHRFYRAARDLGRIFKTEFILQYLSEPELRGRIRRGLLKVEQLHALARDVFYGRRGRINARESRPTVFGARILLRIFTAEGWPEKFQYFWWSWNGRSIPRLIRLPS